ncbi:MAG: PH domain-containing protein, partial [Opitutaceae bacterium]
MNTTSTSSSDPQETLLWRGTPSQWTNLGTYFLCLVLSAMFVAGYFLLSPRQPLILVGLAIPFVWAVCRWIATSSQRYELTSERLKVTTGLFSKRTNELELYRVRDYSVVEPFWLRLVGCGHVVLATADRSTPQTVLRAVPDVAALKDQIRIHTERMRQRRGVRD